MFRSVKEACRWVGVRVGAIASLVAVVILAATSIDILDAIVILAAAIVILAAAIAASAAAILR